jgi:hypothetical protein
MTPRKRLTRRKARGKAHRLVRSSCRASCRRPFRHVTWTAVSSTIDRKMIE